MISRSTSGASAAFETYFNTNLFLVPASGGEARPIVPDLATDVDSASWSKDGKTIYYVASLGVESQIFQLDVATKASKPLTSGAHTVQGWRYVPSAAMHVFQFDEATQAGEVWTAAASGTGNLDEGGSDGNDPGMKCTNAG